MRHREAGAGGAHLVAVGAVLLSCLWPAGPGMAVATLATVLATLLRLPDLPALARGFVLAAAGAFVAVEHLMPEARALLLKALGQGVTFSCLLVVLGLVRFPVRRSTLVRQAAACLLAIPARRRYVAVNAGSHLLSLLFNVGVIPLLGDLLGRQRGSRASGADRSLLMAGMRGAALMTIWSPMGLGFAIVTTSIPGLDPVRFMVTAFLVAMSILAGTCLAATDVEAPAPDEPARTPAGSPAALGGVLLASAALLLATLAIHQAWHWTFITSTVLVLPVFALLWLKLERPAQPSSLAADCRGLFHGIADMRGESAIFLSASVIGAALSAFIQAQPLWALLQASQFPGLLILLACLLLVPLAGALFIPHSIFVVLIAQLFGASTLGQAHPLALALTLSLAWAMAIAVSPISAMALLTGSLCGAKSHVVGLVWNRRFVATTFLMSVAVVLGTYLLGF